MSAWGIVFYVFALRIHYYLCGHFLTATPSNHSLECISISESYKGYSGLADTRPLACQTNLLTVVLQIFFVGQFLFQYNFLKKTDFIINTFLSPSLLSVISVCQKTTIHFP